MTSPRTFHDGRVTLYAGDCLVTLDSLDDNSADSCVCDPPYHLRSIVKRFAKTGRTEFTATTSGPHQRTATGFMSKTWDGGDIAFQSETWAKVLRVLKPGGYIVAFSSSRTFGRMSVAIEDAGFITHPLIGWIFATGFPKATCVKAPGYEGHRYGAQALKPALEPIYVGQKPFSEANGTANILRWGTGAVNIDACRVERCGNKTFLNRNTDGRRDQYRTTASEQVDSPLGRWPANLIHDNSPEVLACFPESKGQQGEVRGDEPSECHSGVYSGPRSRQPFEARNDSGSAARFFYSAKADHNDRLNSKHPTVKPLDLMRWLVRLVTPKNGTCLDPFAGTGTTGHAALIEGCRAILCEREAEYIADIERRMGLVYSGRDERARKLAVRDDSPMPLFGAVP